MLRLIIVFLLICNIKLYAQTDSYLKDENAPGSVEDIVELLNLKNVKKISIFSQKKGTNIFIGEILLNREGRCVKKYSCKGNTTNHTYNNDGKLIEYEFFLNSTEFLYMKFKYDNAGNIVETIRNGRTGSIIQKDTVKNFVFINQMPRYRVKESRYKINDALKYSKKGDLNYVIEDNETITEYTYDSTGYLTRYFSKGFYIQSSLKALSLKENFKYNTIEYRYQYNRKNQIIQYDKELNTKSYNCKVTTQFNYINKKRIKLKSNRSFRCNNNYDKLLYKIEYY